MGGGGLTMSEASTTGVLLVQWRDGDMNARNRLIARLHPELAQIAAARLRQERNASLSTGDLINDAVLRFMRIERIELTDRAHLIALASRMRRHILVDHARAKHAARREHLKVELCTRVEGGEQRFDLISLDSALIRLSAIDSALMELVEMRYFGGMTVADISQATGLSEATVKRRWQTARAWLTEALAGFDADNG
jgi:RNA polymerase sigma factor (TIGR02999 family)